MNRGRKWSDRKAAKTSQVIATKALACKLAKAAWHLASGMSWEQLAGKQRPHLNAPSESYFSREEIAAALRISAAAEGAADQERQLHRHEESLSQSN
jgi:hypothetical protein